LLIRGELDLASAGELMVRGSAELDRGKPLLVELAGLEFADAVGLRTVLALVTDGENRVPPVEVELHDPRGQVLGLISRLAAASGYRRLAEASRTKRAE
jgi:hypothetical protein